MTSLKKKLLKVAKETGIKAKKSAKASAKLMIKETKGAVADASQDIKRALQKKMPIIEGPTGEQRYVHMTGGEFVVDSDARQTLACVANCLSGLQLAMAFGTVIIAVIAYSNVKDFSILFGDVKYSPSKLPMMFGFSSVPLIVNGLFVFWVLMRFRDNEDEGFVYNVRRSIAWIKISHCLSMIVAFVLILIFCLTVSEITKTKTNIKSGFKNHANKY